METKTHVSQMSKTLLHLLRTNLRSCGKQVSLVYGHLATYVVLGQLVVEQAVQSMQHLRLHIWHESGLVNKPVHGSMAEVQEIKPVITAVVTWMPAMTGLMYIYTIHTRRMTR